MKYVRIVAVLIVLGGTGVTYINTAPDGNVVIRTTWEDRGGVILIWGPGHDLKVLWPDSTAIKDVPENYGITQHFKPTTTEDLYEAPDGRLWLRKSYAPDNTWWNKQNIRWNIQDAGRSEQGKRLQSDLDRSNAEAIRRDQLKLPDPH